MIPSEQPLHYAPNHMLAGRFRIVRFLGRGGMGEVYEAADLDLSQHIALKLIRRESDTDPRLISMLRDEVRKARSVSHPNVCRVYDLERDEATGVAFVTMELLRGETLHARLSRVGSFKPAEALPLLRQIAEGMDAIHARRMVHLDFKPANVMLESSNGQPVRAVVTDFGLAKSQAPRSSGESTLVEFNGGTKMYMAPERFLSGAKLTPAADVYAFGLVVYEMLAGRTWAGPPGLPPPLLRAVVPEASPAWEAMVAKCLAPEPERRFTNCGAAIDSLETASAVHIPSKANNRLYWRSLALVACIVAVAAAVFFLRPARPGISAAAMRWYNQGVDAIREGTYYKAVRALEQSLKESPGFPLTHANLAEAWMGLDSPELASEEMLRANVPGGDVYRIDSRDRERLKAIHDTVTRNFGNAVMDYSRLAQSASAAERPRALVDLGRALVRANEPRKAMEQFEAAIRLDPNYAGAYLRLAVIAGQLQQSEKMADALRRAESLYVAASNLEGSTEVFYQRGAYANRQARLNDAAEWLERARQSALVTSNPHQQIRALQQLSGLAYQKGDTAAGQKYAEEAIGAARANNIEFLAGRGFLDLGNSLATRDSAQAAGYFNEALRLAHKYHSGELEATALYSLGSIGIRTRVDEAGAKQVEQALEWFQANGYPGYASLCLVTLGRFRRDRGDLASAAAAFNTQLDLARTTHDDFQTGLALSSIASVLLRQERFPEALNLTLEQLAISKRMGDGLRAGYAQQSLARLCAELGRFTESETAAQEAEAAARKGNIEELLVVVSVTRAQSLLLAGRPGDAANLAERGIRDYELKYPQETGELLAILALARDGVSPAKRLEWCERSRTLAQGSYNAQLSLRLIEGQLHLQAKRSQQALDDCRDIRAAVERQQSEYSIFRMELIQALARRQLGHTDGEAVERANAALERFQKRFDRQAWERFQTRRDFLYWGKNLRQLRYK